MQTIAFKNFVTLQRGFDLPKKDMEEGNYPVVGSTSIIGYHTQYKVEPPGVITGRSGSLGEVQFVDGPYWPHNTALWVKDFKGNYPKYVYYFLKTLDLARFNAGAGVPTLNRNHLDELVISIHEPSDQRRIAEILSAYDDLIEVNTRRIRILERMAQSIYREWFGKVEAESLPDGWEIVKLGDGCNIVMGQSPESKYYNENGEGLPFHQGVTDFGEHYPKDRVFCTIENRIAEKGDILFSVRAPVGRLNIANRRIVIGRGLSAIRSKTGKQTFLFQQLKEQFQEEDIMGGGTIFKSVTKDDVYGIKFLLPPQELIAKFENIANLLYHQLETLTEKNANLRKTRDLLLPRLMGGEIDV